MLKIEVKFSIVIYIAIASYFIGILVGVIGHKMNTDPAFKELKADQAVTHEYINDLDQSKEGLTAILERIRVVVMNTEQKIEMIRIWESGKQASIKYKKVEE